MDTQHQVERLIELAIIQRSELKRLVDELPQLREHLNAEIEKTFEEAEPQMRADLEQFIEKQATDATAKTGSALEAKIAELSANLERTTQARYNAIIAEREENARLAAQAEQKIAEHAASLPGAVKEIVTAELARFPRAGEIDQLRKEFAEPRGLNPRGKWQAGEVYNKLDLVTFNGDSFVSNIDGNRERPSRNAANWTLNAARGTGGGTGFTSLNNVLGDPSSGQIVGSEGGQYVRKTLVAGANITINETASAITIIGDEGQISLQDGTAAAPSLFFTNDTDTGLYRPAANTLGISVSGTQVAYFDANGLTVPSAGVVAGGSIHAANGNANNPSLSFSGDQDTGFFRHQPNELGITLGGTQYATLTSTTFSITPNLVVSGTGSINGTSIPASKTLVVTTDKLSALAITSSSELAGVISDETGTGALVFANTPTLVTPNIGAATGTSFNLTGSGTLGTTLTVSGTTQSTDKDSGAIVTEGGLGVEKNANIGGNATVGGTLTTGGTGKVVIQSIAASNALVDGAWIYGSDLGLNLSPNGAGLTKKLVMAYFDGSAYRSALEFSNVASGTATLKLSDYGGPTTVGGTLTVSGTGTSNVGGTLVVGSTSAASGSGKLELATHMTSAGGIGFGSDTSLYRAAAQSLNLDGASSPQFSLSVSGVQKARLESYSDDFYVSTLTAGKSIILRSGNATTALTLDSSQKAIFAGKINAASLPTSASGLSAGDIWNDGGTLKIV